MTSLQSMQVLCFALTVIFVENGETLIPVIMTSNFCIQALADDTRMFMSQYFFL